MGTEVSCDAMLTIMPLLAVIKSIVACCDTSRGKACVVWFAVSCPNSFEPCCLIMHAKSLDFTARESCHVRATMATRPAWGTKPSQYTVRRRQDITSQPAGDKSRRIASPASPQTPAKEANKIG